jgi:hypothetical protein
MAQNTITDSVKQVKVDTIRVPKKKAALNDPIIYDAKDSIVNDFITNEAFLYNEAVVKYQNIELRAGYIAINQTTKEVYAEGILDSAGNVIQKPVFKEGNQEYKMNSMSYNFNTKKALIRGMMTDQGEGTLHGNTLKKMPNDNMNIEGGKYSTCDHDHPHFYLRLTKAKAIPNEKIVTGPAYLVIEDIPIYAAWLPFGLIPMSKDKKSGVLFPTYGEENRRGFFFRDGGYYFALSDYYDLAVRGSYYSKGSWNIDANSRYKVNYKYNGNLSFNYGLYRIDDEDDTPDSKTWSVRWTHSQDPKARPGTTLSANVNFSSTSHNRLNNRDPNQYLKNTAQSSISYAKTWAGTPFSFSMNLNHAQNFSDSTMTLGLPTIAFRVRQQFPFKRKNGSGKQRWYEKISTSYTLNIDNRIAGKENVIFTSEGIKDWKNGMKHQIPVSTSFNLLKYITVSPSLNYTGFFYTKKFNKYKTDYIKGSTKRDTVITDTIPGFYSLSQYSMSISASTRVYGFFSTKGDNFPIKALRHMATFTIGASYTPGFNQYYATDPVNPEQTYSMYQGSIYGTPGQNAAGNITFNWANNLEMKVRSKKDTVTGFKKVKLLESLNLNTSYNLLADSLNLSKISLSGRTNILNFVNLSFNASFDPYSYDKKTGYTIKDYEVNVSGKLARLTNASMNVDFNLDPTKLGLNKKDKKGNNNKGNKPPRGMHLKNPMVTGMMNQRNPYDTDNKDHEQMMNQYYTYVDFNVDWSFGVRYNISYRKQFSQSIMDFEDKYTQTLNFNGNIKLTPNWNVALNSGWDFKEQKLTYTQVNIMRDLHCWQMSLNWIPMGRFKSFSFQLNVKSAMLKDLKLSKRESWYDNSSF